MRFMLPVLLAALWLMPEIALAKDPVLQDLVLEGMVVSQELHPVRGAIVSVHIGDDSAQATTTYGGAFRLVLTPTRELQGDFVVVARATEGRTHLVALQTASVSSARSKPLYFVLEPAVKGIYPVWSEGRPAPGAKLLLFSFTSRLAGLIEAVVPDKRGWLRLWLPAGQYTLMVSDRRFAPALHRLNMPPNRDPSYPVGFFPGRIQLVRAREIVVRVVDDDTGQPVPSARVHLPKPSKFNRAEGGRVPVEDWTTDESGEAVLRRAPSGAGLALKVTAADPRREAAATVPAGAESIEIRLRKVPTYALRWPIAKTPEAPPEGAKLRILENGAKLVVDEALVIRGHVVLGERTEPLTGYVVHAETHAAVLQRRGLHSSLGPLERDYLGSKATFLPAVPFGFQLLAADGTPQVGAVVVMSGMHVVRDEKGRLDLKWRTHLTLNEGGRYEGEGVFFGRVKLRVLPGAGVPSVHLLGAQEFQSLGAKRPVLYVPQVRTFELHVTTNGEARIPPDLEIRAGTAVLTPEKTGQPGVLRVRAFVHQPGEGPTFELQARETVVLEQEAADLGGPDPVAVHIRLGTPLTISLVLDPKPKRFWDREEIELHRYDEEQQRWRFVDDASGGDRIGHRTQQLREQGIDCYRAFLRQRASRYRFVHTPSGLVHGPFKVDHSKTVWVQRFDLSRRRTVQVYVLGDAGESLRDAVVVEEDGMPGLTWRGGPGTTQRTGIWIARRAAWGRGTFSLDVPTEGTRTYAIEHPLLVRTTFEVSAGTSSTLDIEMRRRIVLTVPVQIPKELREARVRRAWPSPSAPTRRTERLLKSRETGWYGPPAVWIRPTGADAASWARTTRRQRSTDHALLVPFDEPGTFDLWIEEPGSAPHYLPEVEVPAEGATLPPVVFGGGARLRIQLPSLRDGGYIRFAQVRVATGGVFGPPLRDGVGSRADRAWHFTHPRSLSAHGLPPGAGRVELRLWTADEQVRVLEHAFTVEGETGPVWTVSQQDVKSARLGK